MLTTTKMRVETRDELKLLAAMRKRSMVDVVAELVHRALELEKQRQAQEVTNEANNHHD